MKSPRDTRRGPSPRGARGGAGSLFVVEACPAGQLKIRGRSTSRACERRASTASRSTAHHHHAIDATTPRSSRRKGRRETRVNDVARRAAIRCGSARHSSLDKVDLCRNPSTNFWAPCTATWSPLSVKPLLSFSGVPARSIAVARLGPNGLKIQKETTHDLV